MAETQKEICTKVRKEIQAQFKEQGISIKHEEIDKRLMKLLGFKVPRDEAKRNIIKILNREHDLNVNAGTEMETPNLKVNELANGKWANLEVVVKQLWESNHESIHQTGILADESGTVKFTSWDSANIPEMEEGKSYHVKNVITKEWQGNLQVDFNKTSSIEPIDHDVEAGSTEVTLSGFIVAIKQGTGLINRCPECAKALNKGACAEHGKITEPTKDIRIMGYLDDGDSATPFIMGREVTETTVGMTLDECIKYATEELDQAVIGTKFTDMMMGHHYTMTGPNYNQLIVNEIEENTDIDPDETKHMLNSIPKPKED